MKDDENTLYRNNGNGSFTSVAQSVGVSSSPDSPGEAAWADYDNDGDADLYISNGGGVSLFYKNTGGLFSNVAGQIGLDVSGSAGRVAWGDFNGDGWQDLYVADRTRTNGLYRNYSGEFRVAEGSLSVTINDVSWSDFNGDGNLDLLLLRPSSSTNLYRNSGTALVDIGTSSGVVGISGGEAAWADYDNDGDVDLFAGGKLYRNNGNETFSDALAGSGIGSVLMNAADIAWADYDNDGDVDLFVGGKLYRNTGTTGRWLTVRLSGVASSRSALGTRVIAVGGGKRQIRDITSSGLPAEFGLGTFATVDSLIVKWPSGTFQVSTNISTNQIVSVVEAVSPTVAFSPSSSLNFGSVAVGQTAQRNFWVKNVGTAGLTITGVVSNNSRFTFTPAVPPNISVAIGDSSMISVTFAPTSANSVTGTLSVSHSAIGSPSMVTLLGNGATDTTTTGGTGGSPGVSLSPYPVAFDSIVVGSSAGRLLRIKNTGTASLTVSSITVGGTDPGMFAVSAASFNLIPPGEYRETNIVFAPTSLGAKSCVVYINHNASGGTTSVNV
ncbi:MAG: FG-GAP-like repeat-containing protein, partial [Patescibacteria group bacterium]